MPTVRENIAYTFEHFMLVYRGTLLKVARAVAIIALIALALEVIVFNINFFTSSGYRTINLDDRIQLQRNDEGAFLLTDVDHTLEFSSLNTEVRNIRIDFDADQPAQNIAVKIQFTDSAHQTYFDTTEYTVGIPDASVSTVVDPSKFINLQTAGYVENLRIEVVGEDVSYPILLNGVSLNAHRPFAFNPLRFVAVFGLLLLGYAFRPKSAIYRIRIVENPRKSKAGIIFAVAIELALTTTFLFYGSNLVGVATSSYNYGAWNGTSLVNTFEVGGDNAQQYAMLAQAMAKGQLYLEEEPPQWLKDMEDPYDKGARDEAQKETGEPYLFEANADVFEPYVSETDQDMILSHPEGLWHPWSVMLTPIAVNTDRLPDEADWPKNLGDLADPKYAADKIAFCDPGKSGTGATIANNIASLYGWEYITEMLDNCEVLSGSDPMFDAVKDGTYPIGFVNEDLGLKWLEAGLPIELIYPEDGVINTVDCLSIIKGAKNMDNAKLFIDFFGSPENHAVLVDPILRRSTRTDAPLAEGLTPTTEYNLVDADKISRDDITAQYNTAYEQSRAN